MPKPNSEADCPCDASPPGPTLICDLVLSGGVTSGLAYPKAVLDLARRYRFHGIGGTSIGAVVACATAAAEYARRRGGGMNGFHALGRMPDVLAELQDGQTRLLRLFQPQPPLQRLFRVLLAAIGRSGWASRVGHMLPPLLRGYGGRVALALAVAAAIAIGLWLAGDRTILSAIGLAALAAGTGTLLSLLGVAWGVFSDLRHELVPNGFGLCRGSDGERQSRSEQLTDWMHVSLQQIAGLEADDAPLTFSHLRTAPGAPQGSEHGIDCRIIVTHVTHGRPYELPQRRDAADTRDRLFFSLREWSPYFPPAVIAHLRQCAQPYRGTKKDGTEKVEFDPDLRELPTDDLPLVVAARLSMSVPLLISAVPVWSIDYEARGDRRLRRGWIADGGVCSNVPIHLFDAPVPRWPTFGVSFADAAPEWPDPQGVASEAPQPSNPGRTPHDDRVWLPRFESEGRADRWHRFDEKPGKASRLIGFAGALVDTALDWTDHTRLRMPGHRDRVVRVGLAKGQGGMNLRMTPPQILALAAYGPKIAQRLIEHYLCPDGQPSCRWQRHRWVRFHAWAAGLRDSLQCFTEAANQPEHGQPLREQVAHAMHTSPVRTQPLEKPWGLLDPAEAQARLALIAALEQAQRAWPLPDPTTSPRPYTPLPRPVVGTRPPM